MIKADGMEYRIVLFSATADATAPRKRKGRHGNEETSEQIAALADALSKAQAAMTGAKKDKA